MVNTTAPRLTLAQRRELEAFGERAGRFGVNFAIVGPSGQIETLLSAGEFESDTQQIMDAAGHVLGAGTNGSEKDTDARIWCFSDTHHLSAVALTPPPTANGPRVPTGVAIIDLGECSGQMPDPLGPAPSRGDQPTASEQYFSELLRLVAWNFRTMVRTEEQIEMVGTELARVYEELVLLHKISTNMRVTESDTNFLQLACDSLTDIVLVEGISVLLQRRIDGDMKFVIAAGSGLIDIDDRTAAFLHGRLVDELSMGREALLDSEVDSPFRFDWPGNIRNIIAVPLCAKEKSDSNGGQRAGHGPAIIGLMVAVNRIDKPDFDSTDVKLFTSVASGCAVFIENGRLFKDLKELFVGSLKALTSSIDAKDQYTRGHSERVAVISRWIAERITDPEPLDEEQIHTIYLTGLLHDIGKIGIDERVLRKTGKLTSDEMECIKRHPSIGASILRGIKQMRDIVPGVLCHHERMDGKGYPNGLTEAQIPLSGKIIGLADSFDAMTSKRTYRDAMSLEQALQQIREGLGTQFDQRAAAVFLDSDIRYLWDTIQDGGSQVYGARDLAEYGTAAVGTLLR